MRTPGAISVLGAPTPAAAAAAPPAAPAPPAAAPDRAVINLYGQYNPGKPRARPREGGRTVGDSAADREQYFKDGLDEIALIPNLKSVAFPHLIGCGLGGGNWKAYIAMLNVG